MAGTSLDKPAADAVLWSASGTATVLQDVGGQGVSSARAINASGQSIGSSRPALICEQPLGPPSLWPPQPRTLAPVPPRGAGV